ncbi:MAG: VCBS domain-containing protein [Pseudohongiella sp.]|nr:VCBS domain-containing protein [Pseudohongiella sp.]MDP2128713.1 VCBS domain-containing protein [Pseudohongiella sp.]
MSNGKNPNTPTTIKIATLTGAAKNDVFSVLEGTGSYAFDVLANDPGSASLYSLAQVSGIIKDQFPVVNQVSLPSGATIAIVGGQLIYNYADAQSLKGGEVFVDSFTYTIRMANGALSQATASVSVTGENDLATITGDNAAALAEDGETTVANGKLTVSDADRGEDIFAEVASDALKGQYGSFSFNSSTGEWTYTLDNGSMAVQALVTGEIVFDELSVASLDGTATETIKVAISGADESVGPGEDDGSGVVKHILNYGRQSVNEKIYITNFNSGDILKPTGQLEYINFSTTDVYDDGILDTTVLFSAKDGQNTIYVEVNLIGVVDFNPASIEGFMMAA